MANSKSSNYQLSFIINHEKETRTKINHPEYRPFDSIQHSGFVTFQQRPGSLWLSDDSNLYFRYLDDFHHYIFYNHKKI